MSRRLRRRLLAGLLSLWCPACEEQTGPSPPPGAPEPTSSPLRDRPKRPADPWAVVPVGPRPAGAAAGGGGSGAGGGGGGGATEAHSDDARRLERLSEREAMDLVARAAQAASQAGAEADDECERLYESAVELTRQVAAGTRTDIAPLDRTAYLHMCRALPPDVRGCLDPRQAPRRADECRRLLDGTGGGAGTEADE
ncbi:MAG: hypothetical protein NZ898_13640 [Myxococcota bacterium]|nr:hypothetical protein [Myxococcota bacterium]MDW8361066.1 hypothetical protein [Myxococcales bacterium]